MLEDFLDRDSISMYSHILFIKQYMEKEIVLFTPDFWYI